MIVGAQLEAHGVSRQPVTRGHRHAPPLVDLVGNRVLERHLMELRLHSEPPALIEVHTLGSFDGNTDGLRARAGRHRNVVLQPPLRAVVHEIHSGVDACVADPAIGLDTAEPVLGVIAHVVIDHAGQGLLGHGSHAVAGSHHVQPQRTAIAGERGTVGVQRNAVGGTVCEELGCALRLTDIRFEIQRQSGDPRLGRLKCRAAARCRVGVVRTECEQRRQHGQTDRAAFRSNDPLTPRDVFHRLSP